MDLPGSPDNPISAVRVNFLDAEVLLSIDDGKPRVVFHIESADDGAMHSGALSVGDAREMGERLIAAADECDDD